MPQRAKFEAVTFDRVLQDGLPSVLESLSPGRVDLAIWARRVSPSQARQLDAIPTDRMPEIRIDGDLGSLAGGLENEPPPGTRWLRDDILFLATRFAAISGESKLSVKLQAVGSDACRFLHHDYVARRLVCTYRGPGTEWLPPSREAYVVDRRRGVSAALLERVPRFGVAIFTGRTSLGAAPILHRSPPVAGTGTVRLVLTIDGLSDDLGAILTQPRSSGKSPIRA